MRKSYLLGTALLIFTAHAWADNLTGLLTIDSDSYFSMGAPAPSGSSVALSAGSDGGILLGTHQNFLLDPDEPHPEGHPDAPFGAGTGYASTPVSGGDLIVSPFSFFGPTSYVGTNPISYQSAEAHPAPTADVNMTDCVGTVCTLTAELSAWEWMWNGSAMELGPRPFNSGPFVLASGTLDVATGKYILDWSSQVSRGAFNGVTTYWHLEGTFISSAIVIDDTATVAPDVVIGAGSTVGANTVINKGASVGEGSSIGANVTINKDTQLGDNTVVGDGSTINKDVVAGDDLTVGSNVTIHKDVMIGARVTIGDNSQIHSGTVIGNDVTIGLIGGGAGVFVGNRVTIPSNRVIGDGEVIPNDTPVP